jgi:hypothetical protein
MNGARALLENPYLYTHLLSITDVSRQCLVAKHGVPAGLR